MEKIRMRLPITATKAISPSTASNAWPFSLSAAHCHDTATSRPQRHARTLRLKNNGERALVNRGGQPLAPRAVAQ
jgi:hypothetical protein